MQGADIGELTAATVRLVEKGLGAAWFLSHIEVLNTATGSTATFVHNGWLQQNKDNPMGQVELTAVRAISTLSKQQPQSVVPSATSEQEATEKTAAAAVVPADSTEGSNEALKETATDRASCVFKLVTLTSNVNGAGTDAPVRVTVSPLSTALVLLHCHNVTNKIEWTCLHNSLAQHLHSCTDMSTGS